ncbi:MAG: class I SAM-dependent methyltransferase [Saprospiraceae bacterium]|nr:class I SAM-dependent methyltransferase [Saprospiraceae bacterium]
MRAHIKSWGTKIIGARSLDLVRFHWTKWRLRKRNRAFIHKHPDLVLPPPYMLYEAYKIDYPSYYHQGRKTASWVLELASRHAELAEATILDWGCGPARVTRHLSEFLPQATIHGTDYNADTISWCQAHIPSISFRQNKVQPPTSYKSQQFDMVFGISIFTHLSLENHRAWLQELHRVLCPGGILLLTTHGEVFRQKLTEGERTLFDQGIIVVRTLDQEGHRTCSAFQPPDAFESYARPYFDVIEHLPGKVESWGLAQDTWLLRRKQH